MFTHSASHASRSDKQTRRLVSAQISLIVAVFFTAAYFLLNWTLTTEARFMEEGI